MEGKKREWVTIGVAVLIIIVIGFLAWYEKFQVPSGGVASISTPVFAATGQLSPGFPQSLVLDANATVDQSYSIHYAAGSGDQYTAQWDSALPVATVFNNYLNYFKSNSWTIVNRVTKSATAQGVYATNASSSVNIAIMAITNGSRITVSYLIK
jgi:hypothetical protein